MSGSTARTRAPASRAARYAPPRDTVSVPSSTLGFTNGFLLKFPNVYAAGNLKFLEMPAVAIVGARGASSEGRQRAAKLARALVRDDVVVMSGLALGIDEAAHVAAIDAGGKTIAVVGTPLDKAYPRDHAALQEKIWREHLLLTPFEIGTRTFPSHFPERNRVMARLARATVVIEAGDTSGSLHQVVASLELGRPVFIPQSTANSATVSWPQRFLGKPNVYVFDQASDILDVILR